MSKRKRKKAGQKQKQKPVISFFQGRRAIWVALGILAGVTALAMSPLFTADFVDIDDSKLILQKADMFLNNPGRIFVYSFQSPHYKPVTFLTWMLEYRAFGPNPFIFHFNNILLHIFNTILVFFLVRSVAVKFDKLKSHEFPVAFFTAMLFGVHPMHVESVGWAVERKDVLYTCFYLLGLVGYVRYLNSGRILPLLLSAVAYLLSVMSKSPGITMPAILFLLDFVWKRKFSAGLLVEKLGHFAVLGFAMFTLGIIGRSGGEGSLASMLTEKRLARAENIYEYTSVYGKALLAGLRGCLWYVHSLLPVKLSLGYPREQIIGFFGPLIHIFPWILIAAGAVLLWLSRRFPLLFFTNAFFFITLAPAIARLDVGIGIYMSDRYVYLSLMGLLLLIVALIWTSGAKWLSQKTKTAVLTVLCLICAIMTFSASRVWKNTETLWTNVITKYPQVDYAWVNRASFYRENEMYEQALADVTKGIGIQDNANARIQRGLIYRQMGNPQQALADYNRALALEPDNMQAWTNRGNAYLDMRQYQQAITDYTRALEVEPQHVKAHVNLAIAYSSLGDFESAKQVFASAQRLDPKYADIYVNRAILYYEEKDYAKSAEDYTRYLELNPGDHQVHYDLGVVHNLMGNYPLALESVTRAINIGPQKHYYQLRAHVHENMGNTAAAQADLRMTR